MTLPDYTPEMAREVRGSLSESEMCRRLGLSQRGRWARIEAGRAPSAQTWLLALIVGGMHPDYGPRQSPSAPTFPARA